MALGFFRRHQKVVFVIMVVLMVAFLIPTSIQKLPALFGGREDVRATAYGKKVKILGEDIIWAEHDQNILANDLSLERRPGMDGQLLNRFERVNNEDRNTTWCLLLAEAHKLGISASKQQAEAYLAGLGYTGDPLRELIDRMSLEKKTEKELYHAVQSFLTIRQAFETSMVYTPPSSAEVRQLFRDIREQIQLAEAGLTAGDFTAQAKEPTDSQVKAWFDRYRTVAAGEVSRDVKTVTTGPAAPTTQATQPDKFADTFGFGYRQPDKADVAYIYIDRDVVEQAVEPTAQQMMEYWKAHKGELTRKVPLSQPAATQPGEPVKEKEVVITQYSEAIPQIRQVLQVEAATARLNDLQARVRELLSATAATTATSAESGPAADPYKRVAASMLRPADSLLETKIGRLPFASEKLENVVSQLSKNTGVKIVYPYGKDDKIKIDPAVMVDVSKLTPETKLGDALAAISTLLKTPAVKWVTCDTLENALFPSEPVARLPLKAERSGLVGLRELASDPVIKYAWLSEQPTQGGDNVLTVIQSAAGLAAPDSKEAPKIEVGADFRLPMYVLRGERPGRLIWRLMAVERAQDPKGLTADIRKQVVEDIKTFEAFKLAQEAASKLLAEVRAGGDLEKLAEKDKYKFIKTELFARKQYNLYYGTLGWSSVPLVGQNPEFIQAAFLLAPADPDKPGTGKPAEQISLPRLRLVIVAQRVGYKPAMKKDFDAHADEFRGEITLQQRTQAVDMWFAGENVKKRTDFAATEGGGKRGPVPSTPDIPMDDGF